MEAEISMDDLQFEALCPSCKLGKNKTGGVCSVCNGSSMVITPLGRHVLAFVVRNAKQYRAEMASAVAFDKMRSAVEGAKP